MTNRRVVLLLTASLLVPVSARAAEDGFARAKDFYAAADYEEALEALGELNGKAPAAEIIEVAAYEVYCLVALGRSDEATRTIEDIVKTDPRYHPSDTEASPRVRAFFDRVRRALLPDMARAAYTSAKDAFDRKDMTTAVTGFDRAIGLLDEIVAAGDPDVPDLRTLAAGFRDLSRAAATGSSATGPLPPPSPASTTAGAGITVSGTRRVDGPTPAPSVAEPRVYGAADAGVVIPVAISRTMPAWHPTSGVETRQAFQGSVELVIDETGHVRSAAITKTVHPAYDPILIDAARSWSFHPATSNGVAVPYRLVLEIHLGAPAR